MEDSTRRIVTEIGVPALLEQTAEECLELGIACLKLSRKLRNENPTPMLLTDILANLNEEIADTVGCVDKLLQIHLGDEKLIDIEMQNKTARWVNRLMPITTASDELELNRTRDLLTKIYTLLQKGE